MSHYYYATAVLSSDQDLRLRIVAAAAGAGTTDPFPWAEANAWALATQPGWGQAYDAALKANKPSPGRDESVITDEMIHTAVQAVSGQPTPAAE